MSDLEDIVPDLLGEDWRVRNHGARWKPGQSGNPTGNPTGHNKPKTAKAAAYQLNGSQKGANTIALRFRKAPITLPAISIQKRDEA